MAQASITIRLDAMDKRRFEMFCNATGLNISTAINMFIKKVLQDNSMPFSASYPDLPNEETLLAMDEAENMLQHPDGIKTYDSFQELLMEAENEIQISTNQ